MTKSRYTEPLGTHADVYSVGEFRSICMFGNFIDYDGFGYPVRENLVDETTPIKPSKLSDIPYDATHIVWFNR